MEYKEGDYYEFIKAGKNYVIRFIREIEDCKYEYYDLLNAETKIEFFNKKNEVEYSRTIPFKTLEITVCRKLEIKTGVKKEMFFKEFIDNLVLPLNTSLELNLNKDFKYYFKGGILRDKEQEFVENNINTFFLKIEEFLGKRLSQKEKDDFLIKQFS